MSESSHRDSWLRSSHPAGTEKFPGVRGSAVDDPGDVRRYELMLPHNYVTYEEFGRRFFEVAVTEDRVAAAFSQIAGEQFQTGPMRQGPGGLARVSANVSIQQPQVTRNLGQMITFDIRIPLAIEMIVDLRLDKQRFMVEGEIALRASAHAAEPLLLVIEVSKPKPSDIMVHVAATSIRGELLRIVAGVDGEIRRYIAWHVANEIDSPQSQAAQVIDVAKELASAWDGN